MEPIKTVTLERLYDASINTVWHAWTNPKMLIKWWGPKGVSIPACEIELRVGGKIYIVMEAGQELGKYKGTKWPMLGEYTIVEPNTHLVYKAKAWTEGQEDTTQIDQVTELTLKDQDGKTKLIVKATINAVGPGAGMAPEGMEQGFNQSLDKLSKMLNENK